MKLFRSHFLFFALLACASIGWGLWRPSAQLQAAAENPVAGARIVPARVLPVPQDVSQALQSLIRAPYPPGAMEPFNGTGKGSGAIPKAASPNISRALSDLRKTLGVSVAPITVSGVNAWLVTPDRLAVANRNRLLLHVHGGGYIGGGGEAATAEAIMMAGLGGYKVVCVDYRLPPAFPFPAALDDVLTVWQALLRSESAKKMAIFGSSAGGGLALAAVLRAKDQGLPLPAAVSAATPWSDLDKIGDSYFTNEFVDNTLVSWEAGLRAAAQLYADGHDLKDPYLSPVYGKFENFPPTILTTGTRDLFLSNTIRVHRRMRRAGVVADLNVYEGMSHAQFGGPEIPEAHEIFQAIGRFFDRRLAR